MTSVLEGQHPRYVSSLTSIYKADIEVRRIERLDLIWRIANRMWDDYIECPSGCERDIWDAVAKRFTVTDLQSPVLRTITSASHGGKISRRVIKCQNPKEVMEVVNSKEYDAHVKDSWVPESYQYGTSYTALGWRGDKFSFVSLPPVTTQIITADDDVHNILAVVAEYGENIRSFEETGIYTGKSMSTELSLLPDTNYGFIPVAIAKGFKSDCSTAYGMDLIWPATQETVQCTFLMNDAMILERLQSFSTLVIKGNESTAPQNMKTGPFGYVRLQGGVENDAYYITPQAAIDQIDKLIASKFERCAVQCQVPVEIFTKQKSGVNQSAGSSYLTHKPLYDLVVSMQEQKRREELEKIAMIDAMFSWLKNGKNPVSLEDHRRNLEVEIAYERETNPAINQSDAQAYEQLVTSRFIKHEKAYFHFNPDGDEAEQAELESLREADNQIVVGPGVGDGSEESRDEV